MILKANGQELKFLEFDTSKFDRVFLAL